jgi:hypothetical protein
VYDRQNSQVRALGISVLSCPSYHHGPGYSSYAGLHHDVEAPIDVNNNGVFFLNSRLRYDDITDGTGQTIFVGEKLTFVGDLGWMSGTRATLRNAGTPLSAARIGRLARPSQPPTHSEAGEDYSMMPGLDVPASVEGAAGAAVDASPTGEESSVAEEPKPQEKGVTDDKAKAEAQEKSLIVDGAPRGPLAVGGFGSVHASGTNFALGDGSIRYLSISIDFQVYQQLGHRADGKLLSEDSF